MRINFILFYILYLLPLNLPNKSIIQIFKVVMMPHLYRIFWYLLSFSISLNVLHMSVIKDERVYKRSMVAVERSDDLEDDSWGPDSWCNPRKQEKDLKCTRQCK